MKRFFGSYQLYFSDTEFLKSLLWGLCLFVAGVVANYLGGFYADEHASNFVSDLILSNIRVYDVSAAFVYGTWILFIVIMFLATYRPERLPFMLKSIGLFYMIRAVFVSLTHIGPFPAHVLIDPLSIVNKINFGGDLFFSGHTGLPFLLALLFWKEKPLRFIFLSLAAIFAVVVLLGHLHYSIDVLSAFFITYSIYHIAVYLWKDDYDLFLSHISSDVQIS